MKPYPNTITPTAGEADQDDDKREPMTRVDLLAVLLLYVIGAISAAAIVYTAEKLIFN